MPIFFGAFFFYVITFLLLSFFIRELLFFFDFFFPPIRCSLRSRLYDFFHFSLRFGQKERKGKGTCGGEKTKKPRGEPQSF